MTKNTFRASTDQKALAENMQILTGQKGDRLDKALTLREAGEIGLIKLLRRNGGGVTAELPDPPDKEPNKPTIQPPVKPENVTADGAFRTIVLTWDIPSYQGHAYAEVWRSMYDDLAGDLGNNLSKATRIGVTLANMYSDRIDRAFKAYYWVRFVNANGQSGPFHNVSGLFAESVGLTVDNVIASADNFAIYNPAKPDVKEIIFGVTNDGKVAIRTAVIKTATIEVIQAYKITADYIRAGVSIAAPLITGGAIDMGNAYLQDGSAGFGKGGPYGGWGFGWNTIIYSDGSLYTNRLQAQGGNIRNMRIGNCVVEEDCTILGTLYANKIVGSLVQASAIASQASQTISFPADPLRTRVLLITGIEVFGQGWFYSEGSGDNQHFVDQWGKGKCDIYVNGVHRVSVEARSFGSEGVSYRSVGLTTSIPTGTAVTITINFTFDHGGYVVNGASAMLI